MSTNSLFSCFFRHSTSQYEVDINFVIYFMGDPMRENSCELPPSANCSELDNKFCLYDSSGPVPVPTCAAMDKQEADWSDGEIHVLVVAKKWRSPTAALF
jgi:hypothetical protein